MSVIDHDKNMEFLSWTAMAFVEMDEEEDRGRGFWITTIEE